MAPNNTSGPGTSKKKKGGSSKKVKTSYAAVAKEKRRGDTLNNSKKITNWVLFQILLAWLILGIVGCIFYYKRGPSSALLKAKEKKIKEHKQRQAFIEDVTSVHRKNRKLRNDNDLHYGKMDEFTINEEQRWDAPDPRIAALVSRACQQIYCHESLKVVGRTLRTTEPIGDGVKLYEIPRSMQIWDLDAYRDPFVRKHLFQARHMVSGNRMGTEAYLAAYLALELKRAEENPSNFDALRLDYFKSLPTLDEFHDFHPILSDKKTMSDLLGPRSMAHSVLQGYRNMVHSEYNGFSTTSPEFVSTISQDEYFRARLIVMTRVVNVGPPGPEEVMPAAFIGDEFRNEDLFMDELYTYDDLIDVNLTEAGGHGCIALIPIADLFNHHPNNNIDFHYMKMHTDPETELKSGRSFVVTSTRVIGAYAEPMASYGFYTDAHLYARYGFVNGDGSGPIQLSLAYHHEIMKPNISNQYNYIPNTGTTSKFRSYQKRGIVKYLQFDDGYPECILGPSTHPFEAELKRVKLEHLLSIANEYDRWNMVVEPRNPQALPASSTDIPIITKIPQFQYNITVLKGLDSLQETCRFISLTNGDYHGKALEKMKENVGDLDFRIGNRVSDALEFRSLLCISRWLGTRMAAMELEGKLTSEYRRLLKLNREEWGSKNWTAYHVRFGEMQALQIASRLIFQRVSQTWDRNQAQLESEYVMKDDSCPEKYSYHLFQDEDVMNFEL